MRGKIDKMFGGVHINTTEDRSVLHAALRAPRESVRPSSCPCDGHITPDKQQLINNATIAHHADTFAGHSDHAAAVAAACGLAPRMQLGFPLADRRS